MFKTFKIIGRKFDTEKKFYKWDDEKRFFHYDEIEEKELGIFKFKNLKEAEIFLLANFPEYYFGANIVQTDKEYGNDFLMVAVPQYYEQYYKTNDREKIINIIIKKLLEE